MNNYELNTLVSISVGFTRIDNGAPIDPGDVVLIVRQPDCVLVRFSYQAGEVTRDDTGAYHVEVDATMAGHWKYKWEGSYPVEIGSADGEFIVNKSDLVGSSWPTGAAIGGIGGMLIDDAGLAVA